MKSRIAPSLSAFFGAAAFAAAALPEPSATLRLESLSSLFSAASALVAECAGPALSAQVVGGARDAVAASGALDLSAPVSAACWATPQSAGEDAKFAALLSIPAGPDGAAALCGMIGLAGADLSEPVALDALPLPSAVVARDGRLFLALVADGESPAGLPSSPEGILAESAGVFDAAPVHANALLEVRTGRELTGASWKDFAGNNVPGADDSGSALEEVAEWLEEESGIAGALPALLAFADALSADSSAMAASTFDLWVDPADGLFVASVFEFDPASEAAAANAGRAAISPDDLPQDVGADAFFWSAGSAPAEGAAVKALPKFIDDLAAGASGDETKAALALGATFVRDVLAAAKQVKTTTCWAAPDAEGRPYFSGRVETLDGGAALREAAKPARELLAKIAPVLSDAGIRKEKTENGTEVFVPVSPALAALASATAKAAGETVDDGDAARIAEAAKYLERVTGATNVVSCTAADGVFAKACHAAGAAKPAGAPASAAAFSLAPRAPEGLAPVAVGECAPSRFVRTVLKLFPEISEAEPLVASTLFAGVPVSAPVQTLELAGGSRSAGVAHVPMSEIHFLANAVQLAAVCRQRNVEADLDLDLDDDDDVDGDDDDSADDGDDDDPSDED